MSIDSHHHLWRYTPADYGWIDDSMSALQRDFLPADLALETAAAGIDGTIAVQARQTLEETHWLLAEAAASPLIRGVVGWADIASPAFPAQLETLASNPRLVGLRHVVQAEPAGFLDAAPFNAGIRALTSTGLVYDILIFERQLEEAIRFVDRHPNQTFVLDHIAKPLIRDAALEPWATHIRTLALRPNVVCKLSGMVTEANWQTWSPATLAPYFEVVLEAFTPDRLMAGSDWPVCLVASGYAQWWQLLRSHFAALTPTEQAFIFNDCAHRTYRLP